MSSSTGHEPHIVQTAKTVIEEAVPLGRSQIWEWNRRFYAERGVHAWAGPVPFYATSNPAIADSYARIILRFAQDCLASGRGDTREPFYVVELGAGSGAFSFLALRRLLELCQRLGRSEIRFVYVMTDMVEKNLENWRQHPAFQPYLQSGALDFALFDAEVDRDIVTCLSGQPLRAAPGAPTVNPLAVMANYVFDSMPQDLFRVENGQVRLGLTTIAMPEKTEGGRMPEPGISFSYTDPDFPFYGNAGLDELLDSYRRLAGKATLLFPTAALRCAQNLIEMSGGQLCLIVADKGYSRQLEYQQDEEPAIEFHQGAVSMPVNLEALGRFFIKAGGDAAHQFIRQYLQTSAFLAGFRFEDLPETRLAVESALGGASHAALFRMQEYFAQTTALPTIDLIMAVLAASRWDPYVFEQCLGSLLSLIRSERVTALDVLDVALCMEKIIDNFFFVPGCPDVFLSAGVFFQEAGDHRTALEHYLRSAEVFGKSATTLYNMGLCWHFLGERDPAVECLRAAVALRPDYLMARGWLSMLEESQHDEKEQKGMLW